MMRIGHGLMVACLALAACGSGDEAEKAEKAEPAANVVASSAGIPMLRDGLWTVSMSGAGAPVESRMCVDRAMQEQMSLLGGQLGAECSENTITPRPGGGYAMRAVCATGGGGQTVSEGVVTGDLNSSYRSEMTVTTTGSPVPQMNATTQMVSTAVHGGACPADMRPGDMEVQGMRMNILDMTAQARAAPETTSP